MLRAEPETPGFDAPVARIQVTADLSLLSIEAESGAGQSGANGELLPAPARLLGARREPFALPRGQPRPYTQRERRRPTRCGHDGRRRPGIGVLASSSSGNESSLRAALAGQEAPALEVLANAASGRPAFSSAGVVNAASFNQGPAALLYGVSPGGLTSIFGTGFSTDTETAARFPLPRSLAGTVVRVNGVPVPLLLVSPGQINLQVPFELVGAEAQIVVESTAGPGAPVVVPVTLSQPGVFTDASTGLAAVIYASDGRSPWNRPAKPGEYLQIFATGLGAVAPRVETGEAATSLTLSSALAPPEVLIGGRRLVASFAGLAPFFAGLYQVNVQLPADLAPGPYELFLETAAGRSNAGLLEVAAP